MEEDTRKINTEDETSKAMKKLEEAFRTYKISEIFANDVNDDYGKRKIASLRLEFAKFGLVQAWEEASQLGIDMGDSDVLKQTLLKEKEIERYI